MASMRIKRLASFVLAPCIVLTALAFTLPALTVAENATAAAGQSAKPNTGPIGTDNDPWPQSFPRDTDMSHVSKMKQGRIALVFDFDPRYTWETMGGNRIPQGRNQKTTRNFDQSEQIKKYLKNLEGAPVQVGIYTFDRFDRTDRYQNVAWANTPDLPATSLENKDGFDKVMAKLDSLDATDGTGRRKGDGTAADDVSNQEQGLQKVLNDMDKYHYTDVFLFTVGMPNKCGVHDEGCPDVIKNLTEDQKKFLKRSGALKDDGTSAITEPHRWTYKSDPAIAAAVKAYEIQKKGAKLRLMHMYVNWGINDRAFQYAGYMLGEKIEGTIVPGLLGAKDHVKLNIPESIKDQWVTIRHAGNLGLYHSDRSMIDGRYDGKKIVEACNNWHGLGTLDLLKRDGFAQDIKLGGDNGNQYCNHVRDGKFGKTVVDWLQKAQGLAVINDQVDQDLRFIKPNANRQFSIKVAGGNDTSVKTAADGFFDHDGADGQVTEVTFTQPSPREQITPFKGTDHKLHNARCHGWNAGKKPETFYPEDINDPNGIPIGFKFTQDQLNVSDNKGYQLAKCAVYSRPFQEVEIVKRAITAKDDPINTVLGPGKVKENNHVVTKPGATYEFAWKCVDPLNHDVNKVISSSEGILPDKRTLEIKGKVNNLYEWEPLGIGKTITENNQPKSMLPVGAKCEVTEKIKLPAGYYADERENAAKANQLYTSENRVEGRNYQIEIPANASDQEKQHPETVGQTQNQDKQATGGHTFGATIRYEQGSITASGVSPISQLVSTTTYRSRKAGIHFTLKLDNPENDPAYDTVLAKEKAKTAHNGVTLVPVYYNCRFMPDPKKPLELPETNQGYIPTPVQSGWMYVPVKKGETTGEAYIGYEGVNERGELPKPGGPKANKPTWPVGTHCLFSTVAPPEAEQQSTGRPLDLPGFTSTEKYSSTVCAGHDYQPSDGEIECRNNYFWVGSDREHTIKLTQEFYRQHGQLEVSKVLKGSAISQGLTTPYEMKLGCQQERVKLPVKDNSLTRGNDGSYTFTVKPGEPRTIQGVPAAANCQLSETNSNKTKIRNVTVTIPRTQEIAPLKDLSKPHQVEVENTLEYTPGSLKITHKGTYDNNLTSAMQEQIQNQNRNIELRCTDLDGKVTTQSVQLHPGDTSVIPNLSAGSKCVVSADTSGFSVQTQDDPNAGSSEHYIQVASKPVEVTINPGSNESTVESSFSHLTAGELTIFSRVKQWPAYGAVRGKLPQNVSAEITCGTQSYWTKTLDLDMTVPSTISGTNLPENTACKLHVKVFNTWPTEIEGTTEFKAGDGNKQTAANSPAEEFDFTTPRSNQTGTSLVLAHSFREAQSTAKFRLDTPQMWTSADENANTGVKVPDSWKTALLKGMSAVPNEVTCKLGNDTVSRPVNLDPQGNFAQTQVPRGWKCQAAVSPRLLKIAGTDLKESKWSPSSPAGATAKNFDAKVAGADPQAPVTLDWIAGDEFSATLGNTYRVQLASFNVKKKVGGEGVGAIPAEYQFKIHYSCTLNGEKIKLPAPASINDKTAKAYEVVNGNNSAWDATTHLKKDLKSRFSGNLQDAKTVDIVRFQQGEWHPIDALPAGAVCTVYEDAAAKVDSSRLDNYWELAAGYRGREPAAKCEADSKKCTPTSETNNDGLGGAKVFLPTDTSSQANSFYKDKQNATNDHGIPLNPQVPQKFPENFAGTVVAWNNYTFDKAKKLRLTMKLEGNGKELLAGQTLHTRLYCQPPAMRDQNKRLVASQSTKGRNVINADLEFKVTPEALRSGRIEATSDVKLPVNYKCVIAQKMFSLGDGLATIRLSADSGPDSIQPQSSAPADLGAGTTVSTPVKSNSATTEQLQEFFTSRDDPGAAGKKIEFKEYTADDRNLFQGADENYIAAFQMPAKLQEGATVGFTLTNLLSRPGVDFTVAHQLIDNVSGYYNLGGKLNDAHALSYKLAYECQDQYLKEKYQDGRTEKTRPLTYQGEVALGVNQEVQLFAAADPNAASSGTAGSGQPKFIPASSSCAFWLNNAGDNPIAGYPAVQLLTSSMVQGDAKLAGRFHNQRKSAERDPGQLKAKPIVFEKDPGATANSGNSGATAPSGVASGSSSQPANPAKAGETATPLKAKLTFDTWYFTERQELSLSTYTYGAKADEAIAPGTKFTYEYTCNYPQLPGMTFDGATRKLEGISLGDRVSLGQDTSEPCDRAPSGGGTAVSSQPGGPGSTPKQCVKRVVPAGTSCTVTGHQPSRPAAQNYLNVVTNQVTNQPDLWNIDKNGQPQGKPRITSKTVEKIVKQTGADGSFTVQLGGQTNGKDNPLDVIIGHIVYMHGAEIYVRRVDDQHHPVKDAKFDLYTQPVSAATAGTSPAAKSQVSFTPDVDSSGQATGWYRAILAPGTYWVGTTNTGANGAELLWQRYQFDVSIADKKNGQNLNPEFDTVVTLSEKSQHSGLVTLSKRELTTTPGSTAGSTPSSSSTPTPSSSPNATEPYTSSQDLNSLNATDFVKWDLEIGDIRFGTLPLTGGKLPWMLGSAGMLMGAAVILMWRLPRREDFTSGKEA
ncbi:DUF5979 domain-containing protein [Mobiluncus curtisii]|uniref:DUF5979 domain-containing protein n=1 Tax=Mobiluncus curtisii TaxID=2051 RepID=UPI0020169EA1|nr:DUF5979 domain-containing protein [Mobiluncus curtisii]